MVQGLETSGMSHRKRSRVVYSSAFYDLVVTAAFATPWSARWVSGILVELHHAWGLSGAPPSLQDPLSLLFANLMGTIVLIWSVLRLRSPTLEFGAFDTLGRVFFSFWMAFALLNGASTLLLHFLVPEMLWGLVQGGAVYRGLKRAGASAPLAC